MKIANAGTPMRFIGTDGSMKLRKGSVYMVRLEPAPLGSRARLLAYILREGGVVVTSPYGSSDAFFRNWSTNVGGVELVPGERAPVQFERDVVSRVPARVREARRRRYRED